MHARNVILLILALAGTETRGATLDSLVRALPADSLVVPLRRFENLATRPREGAEAAMLLGQLLYARGEYRSAAGAFGRAAARLDPERKPEARYWTGLCSLALQDAGGARAVLEEVAHTNSARRVDAEFGVAVAWEQAQKPEEAFAILTRLAESEHGEILPAILERTIALATVLHKPEVAIRARKRLFAEYPNSIEAARAGLTPAVRGLQSVVELGPFPSEPRAYVVAERAHRAGFPGAAVVARGAPGAQKFVVELGAFASDDEARAAGQKARAALGTPYQVVTAK